jgi:hypothetical protein
MSPDSRGVTQVWHTPVRQLQRVGTSQASARSSTLRPWAAKGAVMPLRAKVTNGPVPAGPSGWWGGRRARPRGPWAYRPVRPGLIEARAPNSSV